MIFAIEHGVDRAAASFAVNPNSAQKPSSSQDRIVGTTQLS
jgi:hypothetical protein